MEYTNIKIKAEIKERLIDLADNKYKSFQEKLCPKTNNIIGVKVPIIRKLGKELLERYTLEELLENIDNEFYEETMLEGILISLERNFSKSKKYIKRFIPKIKNWAICDTFCSSLKITIEHKEEMRELLEKYLNSKKEFEVRFAVVMIINYYVDKENIGKIFGIIDNIKIDYYYSNMAIAWLISVLLTEYYDDTIKYLNRVKLKKFIYNKALQKGIESYKIDSDKKNELRQMKNKNLTNL